MNRHQRRTAHVHKQVSEVAKALTHELYDSLMSNNELNKAWTAKWPDLSSKQREDQFVAQYWGRAIPAARATMATMLRGPYDEALKESIMSALSLDNTLVRGRRPQVVAGES